MKQIWAREALTETGWQTSVLVTVDDRGKIASVESGAAAGGERCSILLPAPANLHSHAFQRIMAGLTERRSAAGGDSFWTWRQTMYTLLEQLSPDDVEAITALAQMEMLEAGFARVAEFHYLHHAPDGQGYRDPGEMSSRIAAASLASGIGLLLLPVLYEQGDCDGRPLAGAQRRFGCDFEGFARLLESAERALAPLPADCGAGVAMHSMRTVSTASIIDARQLRPLLPLHIHAAEQEAEIESVSRATSLRPVEWLLEHCAVDGRWCLIHCTHMLPHETAGLAGSKAVAGLCPVTESNLGDGIFDGVAYLRAGGNLGVGTDSNVRISLTGELRTLEYSQRLKHRIRAALAVDHSSTGRQLFDSACRGGALACGRDCGRIVAGAWADLIGLDGDCIELTGLTGDLILDSWIFAAGPGTVRNVWSAGRHVVRDGQHVRREAITANYQAVQDRLRIRVQGFRSA